MLFVGQSKHTLDSKNRIFIPAKYKSLLGDTFYIAPKMNKPCLGIYTQEAMEEISEKITAMPDSVVAQMKAFYFPYISLVTLDANGRVMINNDLIQRVDLARDVVIVGTGDHLQIWSEDAWQNEMNNLNMDEIRSQLASIGL